MRWVSGRRITSALVLSAAVAAMLAVVAFVALLTRPDQAAVGPAPASLGARDVAFASASGATIHGWMIDGRPGNGAVLLLHGVHANRLAMRERAHFLAVQGRAVLLIDFQAHGESIGRQITFGYLESRDAQAALAYLRAHAPGERVGVIGTSMGGAAAVLAEPPLDADAFVLEQVYTTINDALANRLRLYLGTPGAALAPMLAAVAGGYLGLHTADLRPLDAIRHLRAPLLMIAGAIDQHATLAQSHALFAAAPEPRELWIVDGAAHVDLHRYATAEYERRVSTFFDATLRAAR